MKFKPIYLYGLIFIIAVVFLMIFTQQNDNNNTVPSTDITTEKMPQDDIHKNLQNPSGQNPTVANVNPEVKQKMEELKNKVESNPSDTALAREYADFMAAAHKPDEALKYYESILKKDPTRKDLLFSMTFIYYTRGDLNKAEETTKRILSNYPNDPMANYNLGAIAASRGNKDMAREIWQKIIQQNLDAETTLLAQNSIKKL